jgi:FtsP/CotA-like multicopper oxidase with cupredoxin domain
MILNIVAAVGLLSFAGINSAIAATDAPSDMPVSPIAGFVDANGDPLPVVQDFTQAMLRFEEFDVRPVPTPGSTPPKVFPLPSTPFPAGCEGRPDLAAMDTFLDAPLWPDPSRLANDGMANPWASLIQPCVGLPIGFTGVMEGRPPGISFAHQRWDEFFPAVAIQTTMGQSRVNLGRLDDTQSHGYALGEFGPGGLYHSSVGVPGTLNGTTSGIEIKLHPNLPVQDPLALWTFGDGTLPPKLLRVRYGLPILLRHYNALPIELTANGGPGTLGFGEHTITTHEHNGHQPGESDGFAGAYFFPGQYYDYRWPMALAGYDSINTDASDPRASTPCSLGETLMIPDQITHLPVARECDPNTLTVNIPGDWHEIMSTHWFHDHMIDRTSENVYKGNAAMMNYYSGIDRGHESFRCHYDDPANNINLCLPSGTDLDWGNRDYDVQLLVADKAWAPGTGQLAMADQVLHVDGFLGDRMTVNWLYNPTFDVRARKYRFRILNGSVARFFKIAIVREFDDTGLPAPQGELLGPPGSNLSYSRVPFHMIANDGNIMKHAVKFPNDQSADLPMQCIAERYDIILDFSPFPPNTKLYMVNTVHHDDGTGPGEVIPLQAILSGAYTATPDLSPICANHCWDNDPTVGKFLEFEVRPLPGTETDTSMNPADYEIGKLTMIPPPEFTDEDLANALHRTFVFGNDGGEASDGRQTPWSIEVDGNTSLNANLNRVSAAPETIGGGWEIWHVISGGNWGHPIHIHFEEGQYLSRSDGPGTERMPPIWEQGARKDMYRVSDLGESDPAAGEVGLPDSSLEISVAIRFREFAGTFVEHCHNTTHEDKAMLLRWDNELPGQTSRIPTPIPTWEGVTYVSPATPFTHVPSTDPDGPVQTAVTEEPTIKTGSGVPADFFAPNRIQGDLDFDGIVGFSDFSLFRSQFGQNSIIPWAGDLNEDALVGFDDFSVFRANFGLDTGLPQSNNNPIP